MGDSDFWPLILSLVFGAAIIGCDAIFPAMRPNVAFVKNLLSIYVSFFIVVQNKKID